VSIFCRPVDALELVGLTERRSDRVGIYSGGMQRRLNLACGLIHGPRLLLLDEPTAGVDPQSRAHLLRAIEDIAKTGTTVLYTTHYMEEAQQVCDRVAILDQGCIIAQGTLRELLAIVGMGEVIEIRGAAPIPDEKLRLVPDLLEIERSDGATRVFVKSAARAIGAIADLVQDTGDEATGIEIYPVNLERVFMHLTGRALRD